MARSFSSPPDGLPVRLPQGLSIYLDLLRCAASAEVFLYHFIPLTGLSKSLPAWAAYGHEAVIVFFVLSGFVISYAGCCLDRTASRFAISRLTRLYTVAVPALLLTVGLDFFGVPLHAPIYDGFAPLHSPLLRFGISLLMLNELWVSVQAFSNGPYWSACYELTYYVIFGCFCYARGAVRVALLCLTLLLIGPRTLLLFPVWMVGSYAYFEARSRAWPRAVHWVLFLLPLPVVWFYTHWAISNLTVGLAIDVLGWKTASFDLGHSRQAITDFLLGVAFALHLVGAKHLGPALAYALRRVAGPVRMLAGYTFTLYMVHLPVMLFVYAALSGALPPPLVSAIAVFAVFGATAVIGGVTERQRHRIRAVVTRAVAKVELAVLQ